MTVTELRKRLEEIEATGKGEFLLRKTRGADGMWRVQLFRGDDFTDCAYDSGPRDLPADPFIEATILHVGEYLEPAASPEGLRGAFGECRTAAVTQQVTQAEFDALVQSIDRSTEAGRKLFTALRLEDPPR